MADEKLVFGIGFDLDEAVKQVENEWKTTYHKKLQKAIDKTPLTIKLKLDSKDIDLKSLREYVRMTKEAATVAKIAADAEAKRALARKRNSDARVAEATEEARIAQKTAQSEYAQLRLAEAQKYGTRATSQLSSALNLQSTYLGRLIQRMGIYFGFHQFASMLRNIRETTAEFELQQVALGALIQDAHAASVLFSKIKAAAVESPYQIKELVNYTKQLAAYGFEQKTLFDTTMRLADISAGLGAEMSRIILAVGQISAATVLKGTELRQLTELGIPMVELLAEKLTLLRGETVSTAEVFEMISDKAISFKMVEEVLNDLTDSGGMFYDMQKKQAETLAGQWSNLKDTIAIAYDEIGNTERVRGAMEGWIAMTKNLAENWKSVSNTIVGFAITLGVIKTLNRLLSVYTANTNSAAAAQARLALATKNMRLASEGGMFFKVLANQSLMAAKAMRKAAQASNFFAKAFYKLKAAFLGNWIMIVIAAIAALIVKLVNARQKANELKNELAKIGTEGAVKMEQSVRNFERLAKIAVDSVDGTKEQTEALKELQRTYGDIIPTQDLSIERLRALKGNYDLVTQAIREKIAMQTLEQKVNTIQESFGSDISKQQKKFKEYLEETAGLSSEEAIRVISNIQRQIAEGAITAGYKKGSIFKGEEGLRKAIAEEVFGEKDFDPLTGYKWDDYYGKIVKDLDESYKKFVLLNIGMEKAIQGVTDEMSAQTGTLGKYTDAWTKANEQLKKDIGNITVPKNTKLYEEEEEKARIKNYTDFLKNTVGAEIADFDINDYVENGIIDFQALLGIDGISVQARNSVRQVQDALQGLEGWKKTVQDFARDVTIGGISRKLSVYTDEEVGKFSNLKDALEDVAKKWKEYDAEVTRYASVLKGKINPEERKYTEGKKTQSEELKRQAYEILKYYNALDLITEKGKGNGQDEWIVLMKNRASFMKDFQQGVENLSKKMKEQDALFKEQGIMANRGISVGYDVSTLKGTPEELSKWYEDAIKEVTQKIKSVGGDEGFAELSISAILKKDTKNQLIKSYQDLLQWLFNQKTDFEIKQLEEDLKREIDRLATAVSRSKEAKNFYEKMLDMTGDRQLSADLTMSVYGGVGDDLKENIKEQLTEAFRGVDISDAISGKKIDYKALEALIDQLPKDMQANARKIVEEGIKSNASIIADLYKTLIKFEDYEGKRVNILRKGIEERRKIEEADLAQSEKDRLKAASRTAENKALAKLEYEDFKSSDMYITMFENLDYVSSDTLRRMREKLLELKTTMGESLDPTQLKEIVSKMEDIDAELSRKNPFKTLSKSIQEYKDEYGKISRKSLEKDLLTANKERDAARDDADAKADAVLAQEEMLRLAEETYGVDSEQAQNQRVLLEDAKEELAIAKSNLETKEQALSDLNDQARAWRRIKKAIKEAIEGEDGIVDWFNSAQSMLDSIKNLGEGMGAGERFSGWMEAMSGILGGVGTTATGIGQILSGQWAQGLANVVKGLSDVALGIFDASYVERIAKANSEIAKQTGILEYLAKSYEVLKRTAEDAFGTEYLDNYSERLAQLYAMQAAYQAQADAERDKGKKTDEEAAKDYDKQVEETAAQIEEMYGEISERLTGTDLGSAARDFADAWLEAYKTFGNTADAIGTKFREMIDNMVSESVIAGVMKTALKPVFDMIDNMTTDDLYNPRFWQDLSTKVDEATTNADIGATNAIKMLEAMGINIREMGAGLTGISKDIATASEESILGLAAGINTQNFYISQIHAAVLRIEMLMQSGAGGGVNVQDLITIQNQHLAHLPNIAANTAGTLQRCEQILGQVTDIATNLGRVIAPVGTPSTHQVHTTLS